MGSKRAKTKSNALNKHEKHQKKQKRITLFVSVFLASIMILSVFGVMLYNPSGENNFEKQEINGFGFEFIQDEYFSYWKIISTPVNKEKVLNLKFFHMPTENSEIIFNQSVNGTIKNILDTSFIYVTTDPMNIDVSFKLASLDNSNSTEFNETEFETVYGENFNATLLNYQYQNLAKTYLIDALNIKGIIAIPGIENAFPGLDEQVISCLNATSEVKIISYKFAKNIYEEGIFEKSNNCFEIIANKPESYLIYTDVLNLELISLENKNG